MGINKFLYFTQYVVNKYLWNEIMDFHPRQEPWDLALLTKNWCTNLANIRLPFLEEITFGGTVQLAKCKTAENGLLPSAECKSLRSALINCTLCISFAYYLRNV
jgi:hypothetical protein